MTITFSGGISTTGEIIANPNIPPPFIANAVNFDGTDNLTSTGALSGGVDNKTGLISFWFNLKAGDGNKRYFFHVGDGRVGVFKATTNQLHADLNQPGGSTVWSFNTTTTFLVSGGWIHFLASVNASNSVGKVYINDVSETLTSVTLNNANIEWDRTGNAVGSRIDNGDKINADIAELYVTNEFLDLTDVDNRRLFIDDNGKPVNLGSDGSTPTSTIPLIYLSGATSGWHTNKGGGGGFTENGTLTDGASSPSD